MRENNNGFENEYDSLKDVTEFQNNMFNPGHYIGTGRVMPTVSAPGNATPMAVVCCVASVLFLVLGIFVLFSDIINKIALSLIMLGISALCVVFGIAYLKKRMKYHKEKTALENEETDKDVKDELWQRTCPKCGETHDIDYPKCPNCKYNYLE